MRIILISVLLLISIEHQIKAEERPISGDGFVMYPVTTLLQRMQLARNGNEMPGIRAFIAVNGADAIAKDGTIDSTAMSIDQIRQALATINGRAEGVVVVDLYLETKSSNRSAEILIELALESLGRRAGFDSASVRMTYVNGKLDWGKTIGAAAQPAAGPPNDDETPVGDEHVQIFPVRTDLSRFLTGGSDCVIDIRVPFEKEGEVLLRPEVRQAIFKHIATLDISSKNCVLFRSKTSADRAEHDRALGFVGAESEDLARKLGFRKSAVQLR